MKTLVAEKLELKTAVDEFAREMIARAYEKAENGYRGWDDDAVYSTHTLLNELTDDAYKLQNGKLKEIDIAIRAMFLWYRRQPK